ncbi:SRPBCC family protein [Haloferacaceae archaeon DSL9]
MPTYSRRTRIDASLEDVWDFHSDVSGLQALTPRWMRLDIEAVRGPDGEPDPDELEVGAQIRMSIQPFGVGPRQRWVSRITERAVDDTHALFEDDMEGGPFRRWHHTHEFFADGDGTVLVDTVEYELPFGSLGAALGPFSRIGFEPMFRDRHRRTKDALE